MSITSDRKFDQRRGAQDAWQAFDLLRARWPKAFPAKAHEVRPLVNIAAELQEAFGWSPAYAKGVLSVWKAREAYCRAVLAYPNRVGLDGSQTEQIVDDNAREMASARLVQIAATKAKAATALRICMDRIAPARRDRPTPFRHAGAQGSRGRPRRARRGSAPRVRCVALGKTPLHKSRSKIDDVMMIQKLCLNKLRLICHRSLY
jgi:hypothetical protein